jgi:hypothetical protein
MLPICCNVCEQVRERIGLTRYDQIWRSVGFLNSTELTGGSRVLAFDALIGNTDRHPENWGFLVRISQEGRPQWSLAPIFDNATSLGYELTEAKLSEEPKPTRLDQYIDRGSHHCSWDMSRDSPTPHMELCRRLAEVHPEARFAMRRVVGFDAAPVVDIADECSEFDVGVSFTRERARFVSALIEARKRRLSMIVGE